MHYVAFGACLRLLFITLAWSFILVESKVQWTNCTDLTVKSNAPYYCANLTVPLDYTNSSSEPLTIRLVRVPATTPNPKGSVIFNFGGPGELSREVMVQDRLLHLA